MIKLANGDCLIEMQSISDKSIDMILCDLPYGTTACKWDTVIPFDPLWKQYKRIIKDRGAIVLFGSEPFSSYLRMSNIKEYKYDWVWKKTRGTNFLNAKHMPLNIYEIVSIFSKESGKIKYYPQMAKGKIHARNITVHKDIYFQNSKVKGNIYANSDEYYPVNVVEFQKDTGEHPTQKPVALLEYLIRTYTLECETVLDNCMGSGSTGVACVNTGRDFIGIELDAGYFDIASRRIAEAERSKAGMLL